MQRDDSAKATAVLADCAPAKVNLTLQVAGRRSDGYHELMSLVAFADFGDALTLTPGVPLALAVDGATAADAGDPDDNLVLKAARALARRVPGMAVGRFELTKQLPVAAGLGGGSSDAAAALRLLAVMNGLPRDDPRAMDAARSVGADVPVCLDPQPRLMRGIGEMLSAPIDLPPPAAVLVNPRVAVPTREVFARLAAPPLGTGLAPAWPDIPADRDSLLRFLHRHGNDLETPARAIAPVIACVLDALSALAGCEIARMSGSGATCFAIFQSRRGAQDAVSQLRAEHPAWWMQDCVLGTGAAHVK